jgi:hypothetical protein
MCTALEMDSFCAAYQVLIAIFLLHRSIRGELDRRGVPILSAVDHVNGTTTRRWRGSPHPRLRNMIESCPGRKG